MKIVQIALAALSLALATTAAAQTLKNQLVGTWDLVIAEVAAPDGRKSYPFGKTPKGMLIFTADGHFTQIHVGDVPWIASNNRLTGTVDEYKGIMLGSLSLFGTYAVDEEKKTVTFRIVSGTFPNLAGDSQTRTIDRLTADEFVNTNPSVAGGRGSASNFYKRAK